EEIRVSRLRRPRRCRLQESRSRPYGVIRGACLPGEYQGGEDADADQQWPCSHEKLLSRTFSSSQPSPAIARQSSQNELTKRPLTLRSGCCRSPRTTAQYERP